MTGRRLAEASIGAMLWMTTMFAASLVLAPAMARPSFSFGAPQPQPGFDEVCHEDAGSCFEVHDTPGCNDPDCCKIVCTADPFCCSSAWDEFCAQAAKANCEELPVCPAKGSCFEPHDGVGCEDVACCELMCEVDGFCCNVVWDAQCAALATTLCGTEACELPPPSDELLEEEPCDERTNDGCTLPEASFAPIACGDAVRGTAFTGTPRDTDWYELTIADEREVAWTITSEFPAHLLILEGTCAHALSVVDEAFGGGCRPASLTACLEPGTYYLFVAPGAPGGFVRGAAPCPFDPDKNPKKDPPFEFWGFDYLAELSCSDCAPDEPADLNGDGIVNISDLLILLGQWGDCADCPADFNGDGVVNVFDLLVLLGAWG